MKKARKVLSMLLVIVLSMAIAVGGTLAYLTDTDNEDNTFTIGNVQIDLIERQRDEVENEEADDDGLYPFQDNKVLLPIVGSAQGEKDNFGMPTAANFVDKIVDVKNIGTEDAYVRIIMAFPAAMDAEKASDMMMHWNIPHEMEDEWTITGPTGTAKIDGVDYNLYQFVYEAVLEADEMTDIHALIGVYIDSRVDATVDEDGNITYFIPGTEQKAVFAEGTGPQIKVYAQAVQAAGFATATEAFTAANMPNNPWPAQ